MKRRTYLGAVLAGVAGLSGCSGPFGGGSGDRDRYDVPERTDTGTPTTGTPTDEDLPWDSLSQVTRAEINPLAYAVSGFPRLQRPGIDLELGFRRPATADHPATFAVGLENHREVPAVLWYSSVPGLGSPVGELADSDGAEGPQTGPPPATLSFVPTDRNDLLDARPRVERQGRYWVTETDPTVEPPDYVRLDPGETVVAEFAVVAGPRGEGRRTGSYRFGDDFGLAVWNTERPGPSVDSRFEGESVPGPAGHSVGWYHEAGPSTRVYVEPSTERTDLPGLVDFELVNHTTDGSGCGDWGLFKRHEGEWFRIDPRPVTLGERCRLFTPGSTSEWSLRAYHGDRVPSADEGLAVGHLGGGRYAAVVEYGDATDAVGALFEVDAPAVDVSLDPDVAVLERGERTVIASEGLSDTDRSEVVLRVVRSEGDPDHAYIAEQLLQPDEWGVRNALAAFESGVESVVFYTADRPPVARSSFETGPDVFAYAGETFEVSAYTQ